MANWRRFSRPIAMPIVFRRRWRSRKSTSIRKSTTTRRPRPSGFFRSWATAATTSIRRRWATGPCCRQRCRYRPKSGIAATFGEEFASALAATPVGEWTGPVRSTFGVHIVRIDERKAPRDPELSEVAEYVRRDWEEKRRREIADQRYDQLRKRYTVVVEATPPAQAASAETDGAAR